MIAILFGLIVAAAANAEAAGAPQAAKVYTRAYFSCSSPPSSIEVCLSSVFATIESYLTSIESELASHEASIKREMEYEKTMLNSEETWVRLVSRIASSVSEAIEVDYQALVAEVGDLQQEEQQINEAYAVLAQDLNQIILEAQDVEHQKAVLYAKYESIRVAKWSVYKAISAIVYQKAIVQQEEAEIEEVVSQLNSQMEKIAEKISQLNKRQCWLNSWEEKLYTDLSSFQSNVRRFRSVEYSLERREISLYQEQQVLLQKAQAVEKAVMSLKAEYAMVAQNLERLVAYEKIIVSEEASISREASVFISAYTEFTCEDSLLSYEACSTPSVAAAPAPPMPPAKGPKK